MIVAKPLQPGCPGAVTEEPGFTGLSASSSITRHACTGSASQKEECLSPCSISVEYLRTTGTSKTQVGTTSTPEAKVRIPVTSSAQGTNIPGGVCAKRMCGFDLQPCALATARTEDYHDAASRV